MMFYLLYAFGSVWALRLNLSPPDDIEDYASSPHGFGLILMMQ